MRKLRTLLAGCCLLFPLAGAALAQPPAGSDLKFKDWFESLQQLGSNSNCCSIADCHITSYRSTASGNEVPIDGRWVPVPPEKVLQRVDNPTGQGVVCYLAPDEILCFVRAAEG